jgi:hypothetical protein
MERKRGLITQEDYGYAPKTGMHIKNPLTRVESAFLGIIWIDHVGPENKIPAKEFAKRFAEKFLGYTPYTRDTLEYWKRRIRAMQNHILMKHDIPVLSEAGINGGYYISEEPRDGYRFHDTFIRRGKTGFVKGTCGKKSSMVDAVTQMTFEWDDLVDQAGLKVGPGEREIDAPVEIVDAFFQKMLEDPERFAAGLRKLGEKYGSVLVPRKRFDEIVSALKTHSDQLQGLVKSLEI